MGLTQYKKKVTLMMQVSPPSIPEDEEQLGPPLLPSVVEVVGRQLRVAAT